MHNVWNDLRLVSAPRHRASYVRSLSFFLLLCFISLMPSPAATAPPTPDPEKMQMIPTYRVTQAPVRTLTDGSVNNEYGLLTVTKSGEQLSLSILPTQSWAAGETEVFVWKRADCTELNHWTLLSIGPTKGWAVQLNVGALTLEEVSVAFVRVADRQTLIAYGPDDCLYPPEDRRHIGYGVNVREISAIPSLVDPLGFEWVKLWEEYSGLPDAPLSKHVLYNIDVGAFVNDLNGWRLNVRAVASEGLGMVRAYEIGNEPNVRNANWGGNPPDAQRMTQMLCIAYEEIKAVDPSAYVISGGLAPVGRVPACANPSLCNVIDEQVYLRTMLTSGAGDCMDGFGYHPYGFAYAPERDPTTVENGFAFRGTELMYDILVDAGYGDLTIWATELNWIRHPAEDGNEYNCADDPDYRDSFLWQEVSAATQADYLVRAFEYAETHWPWMRGMFVWNLDWHDYKTYISCFHPRYYALRRRDGSTLGATTPAYDALVAMEKNPWDVPPAVAPPSRMEVQPTTISLVSEVSNPKVITRDVVIDNTRTGEFTWTATPLTGNTLNVSLDSTQGSQGESLSVTVNTTGLAPGRYAATLRIDADPASTLNAPQTVEVRLQVVTEFNRTYLPTLMRGYASPSSSPTPNPTTAPQGTPVPTLTPTASTPHGPSKIGTHAIGDGGTTDLVRQVANAGGHVAVVKGLSFGYLCEVKQISPETVTIGRKQSGELEAIIPEGDPAEKAADRMSKFMEDWEDYRACVDYWEVLNEADPPTTEGHVWLAEFYKAAMTIADANGYKLALFSYSMGVPEMWEWQAIAETGVFAQAKATGHILALHEYGGPMMTDLWGEPLPIYPGQDPQDPSLPRYADRGVLAGRYRHLYRDILIPRNEVIPLVITEANLNHYDPDERAEHFLEEIAWYDDRLREDDYVIGMNIFTLTGGIPAWEYFEFHEFLPDLAARIIALKDE